MMNEVTFDKGLPSLIDPQPDIRAARESGSASFGRMLARSLNEVNQLNAVTITAGSFAASDESRRTIFRALDIATTNSIAH